jgi:hypothetical protein
MRKKKIDGFPVKKAFRKTIHQIIIPPDLLMPDRTVMDILRRVQPAQKDTS